MIAQPTRADRASAMRLFGLMLMLVPFLGRAMSLLSMLPGWDLDPLIAPSPFTGIGPAESITLDAVALVGAALMALFAQPAGGTRTDLTSSFLLAAGAVGVLVPMWPGDLGDRRIGLSWLSAMLAAGALWLCRDDQSIRRITAAVLLGFVGMLALKAAQQIFIEHPHTVAQYRADPGRFLASQGLLPDTPMARAFERRLMQAEATGWFGLANVFATFMAAMAVAIWGFLGIARPYRTLLTGPAIALFLFAGCAALFGLAFAGAKGGALAVAAGFGALLISQLTRRMPLSARARTFGGSLFGLAAVLGPIVLIILRGTLGERIGELSLLFRWFYMQGAIRIFADRPLGVGPDGFQQAYLIAKPPLSPEEVTSPHSIILDWLADLGIFGIAWIALLLIAAAAIGRAVTAVPPQNTVLISHEMLAEDSQRIESRLALLLPGLATLLAAYFERAAVTPDSAIVRLFGLIVWCAATRAMLSALRIVPLWPIALACGAIAILAHTQIDVAASWPQSVGLLAIWIAIAAPAGRLAPSMAMRRIPHLSAVLIAASAIISIVLSAPLRAWNWQSEALAAMAEIDEVSSLNARLASMSDPTSREDPAQIAAAVAQALSRRTGTPSPAPRSAQELGLAMARLESITLPAAADHLLAAAKLEPAEWRIRREASRLLLRAATAAEAAGDKAMAGKSALAAVDAMALPAPEAPGDSADVTAPEWRWQAIATLEAARIADLPELQSSAAAALQRAAALDPFNLEIALRLMRLHARSGNPAAAAEWAGKVLELDPLMRLDRQARGLTESERIEARRLLPSP